MLATDAALTLATDGYVVIPDFVRGPPLDASIRAMDEYFPPPADAVSTIDERLNHAIPFPFASNELNRLVLDPTIIDIADQLLEHADLRLTSSFIQAKYGTNYGQSRDQKLHNDAWSANSMLYPRTDGPYQRLFGIIYLSDVTRGTAPTYIVGRASALGVPLITSAKQATYNEEEFPDLYTREHPIEAKKGSLLLFVGDVVHRGSAFSDEDGRRLALFFNIHSTKAGWTDKHLWAMRPSSKEWRAFSQLIAELQPSQRSILGFPPPGDSYWNDETLEHAKQMYPRIDLRPYAEGATVNSTLVVPNE